MSQRRFVIHIGPHKTGTSYLQLRFAELERDLMQRGIVFPQLWRRSAQVPSHVGLADLLRRGDRTALQEGFGQLAELGGHTVLLSAEDLSTLEPEAIAALKTHLQGCPATIVFYVRRWAEILPSAWQETVKQGGVRTLPEYLLRHSVNPIASPLLNFDIKLSRFVDVFGLDNVKLVSSATLKQRSLDLLAHFCATFLGWPDPPSQGAHRRSNASRTTAEIEVLRAMLAMSTARSGTADPLIRKRFDTGRLHDQLSGIEKIMAPFQTSIPFDERAPHLLALQRKLFAQYGAAMVEPFVPGQFFRPRHGKLGYVHTDYLFDPRAPAALGSLYDKLYEHGPPA